MGLTISSHATDSTQYIRNQKTKKNDVKKDCDNLPTLLTTKVENNQKNKPKENQEVSWLEKLKKVINDFLFKDPKEISKEQGLHLDTGKGTIR